MPSSLPAAPSLEQLRKQAKDRVRAGRGGHGSATPSSLIAREHGFPSWPRLQGVRRSRRRARAGPPARLPRGPRLLRRARLRAARLGAGRDRRRGAAFERHGAPLTRDGARTVVAREHGFASWPALRRHVAGAARRPASRSRAPTARSRRTTSTALARAARPLPRARRRARDERQRPARHGRRDLRRAARARCCSTAAPTPRARQRPRLDAAAPGRLQRPAADGADAARRRRAGRRLGARRRRHAAGRRAVLGQPRRPPSCSPSRACTRATCAPRAGLGALEVIDELAAARRPARTAASTARTAASRPGSPSDDPQEALDEALAWAARSDRVEARRALVARGADVDGRRLPRHRAGVGGRAAAAWPPIRRLVALGADPNQRSTFGGPEHGEGARRCTSPPRTATSTPSARCSSSAPTRPREDGIYDATPGGWAEHGGHAAARDLLR